MIKSARDLVAFAQHLDLSSEFIFDLTGYNIHRFRRGRFSGPLALSDSAQAQLKRLEALYLLGFSLWGDEEKNVDWIHEKSPTLGGSSPLDMAETEQGFQKVKTLVEMLVGPPAQKSQATKAVPDQIPQNVPSPAIEAVPEKARVAEGLQRVLENDPTLTQALLASKVQACGLPKFAASRASRLVRGYADATSEEIISLAKALGISTAELMRR